MGLHESLDPARRERALHVVAGARHRGFEEERDDARHVRRGGARPVEIAVLPVLGPLDVLFTLCRHDRGARCNEILARGHDIRFGIVFSAEPARSRARVTRQVADLHIDPFPVVADPLVHEKRGVFARRFGKHVVPIVAADGDRVESRPRRADLLSHHALHREFGAVA